MRGAESHHGIGGVGEAKKAANNLQIGVEDRLRSKRKLTRPGGQRQNRDRADYSEKQPKAPKPRPNLFQYTHRSPS